MRLSPIFNLILNVPLTIGWLVLTGLLGYNIYGTLSHSCTLANWGNDDGTMVCQQYKALFSFVVFAALSQIAMIIVDVRARIAQNRSGKYAQMDSTTQLKLEPYDSSLNSLNRQASFQDAPFPPTQPQRRETFEQQHEQFTANYEYHDDQPGWRPGQRTETTATPYAAQAVARKPVARTNTTNTTTSSNYMTRTDTLASSQPPHRTNTVVSSQYGEMDPYRGHTPVSSHYGEVPHRNNTVASSHYSEAPPMPMPMPHRNNTVASSHYGDYSDIGGRGGQQAMRMQLSDYDHYQQPAQSTGYDSSYGQQQYTAYNPQYR